MLYEKIPSLLYEFSISSSDQDSLVVPHLILKTYGFQDNAISETWKKGHWSLKVFSENIKQFNTIKVAFKRLKLPKLKITSKTLKPNQWLTLWKTQWKPLSLTKLIDVVPLWYKDQHKGSKDVIYLDTVMSFGTGLHETTQLIAQLIEDNSTKIDSFLDVGTGTGILTLVALKLGAKFATAMDISPLSITASKSNLKANNLKAKLLLSDVGQLPSKEKYQMVAANLITNDLLKCSRKLVNLVEPGGLLLVSGISLDNLTRLKNGFKDLPLTCRKVSQGKQWAAILYAKKMS